MQLRAQLIPSGLNRSIVGIEGALGDQPQRGLGQESDVAARAKATAYAVAAYALYKTVVEPAASVIAQKRLLIVADGALNYIPFEALVSTSENATDYATLPYLVKTNEMVYAPSASVVAALRQQGANARATTAADNILLVADPIFDANDPRAKTATAGAAAGAATRGLSLGNAISAVAGEASAGLKLARLRGTRSEAEQIAQLTRAAGGKAEVWLDLDANEMNVDKRDLKQYRVLHFATHGLLNAEHPQFTGLALSLVGNQQEDGFLRTDEVFNLRLSRPLVMLSACETGLGKEKRGEGVIGLTRAFMYAGAPTVGVSLWSVSDRSTALLMTDFYTRLLAKEGASPSASLRAAQQSMIESKRYNAPFFWAPFILVGDGQ